MAMRKVLLLILACCASSSEGKAEEPPVRPLGQVWARHVDLPTRYAPTNLRQARDGTFLCVATDTKPKGAHKSLLLQLDADGEVLEAQSITNLLAVGVGETDQGYLCAGTLGVSNWSPTDDQEAVLLRFGKQWESQGAQKFGQGYAVWMRALIPYGDASFLVFGGADRLVRIDGVGAPIWTLYDANRPPLPMHAVWVTPDGGAEATWWQPSINGEAPAYLGLIRITPTGNIAGTVYADLPRGGWPHCAIRCRNGDYLFGGDSPRLVPAPGQFSNVQWLSRWSSSLTMRWQVNLDSRWITSLDELPDGSILAAGSPNNVDHRASVIGLDASGSMLWRHHLAAGTSSISVDGVQAVATDDGGVIYTAPGVTDGVEVVRLAPQDVPSLAHGVFLSPVPELIPRGEGTGPFLSLIGSSNHTYVIERSVDLNRWLPQQTNTVAGVDIKFRDLTPGEPPTTWFRARETPNP
jgi:hypothetical protein